ncbi:MAG TPA: hypothetical protein VEL76_22880 [Gemmataceae bacterium]|nr:hypothetical protein [Gemmataceae bacterium]
MTAQLPPGRLLELFRKPVDRLTARDAADLAGHLGPAAPWLLPDALLPRLADEAPAFASLPRPYRPKLPDVAGACGVLYAVPAVYRLLRPAFLLPVQWREGATHDGGLPDKLHDLAGRVRRHLNLDGVWSLHRLPPFDRLNLAHFDDVLEHESGWAPLAGGLYLRAHGGRPCPDVWATGRWDGDCGVVDVGGLEAKAALAWEWGATKLFVPERQARTVAMDLIFGKLYSGLRAPADALRDYRAALDAMPLREDSQDERLRFYFRQPERHPATTAFYRSHFLPEIIRQRRDQLVCDYPGWAPTHLVTVVSGSPELILLAARALDVRYCVLLYTKAEDGTDEERNPMRRQAHEIARELRDTSPIKEPLCASFSNNDCMAGEMWHHIAAFARDVSDEHLAFDATPGSKLMTLALEQLARRFRPGASLVYVRSRMEHQRVIPFTEYLHRWQGSGTNGPFATLTVEAHA